MADVSVIKLKVRRGTDAQRKLVVLDQGEIGYTTDSKRLFVGDGSIPGGISAGSKFYNSTSITADSTLATAVTGDFVYDKSQSGYYILTGGTYNSYASYKPLNQQTVTVVNQNVSSLTGLYVEGNLTVSGYVSATGTIRGGTSMNVISNYRYKLMPSDNGGMICSTNTGDGLTACVEGTSYVDGFQVGILQLGTSRVTLSGIGITLHQSNNYFRTNTQYSAATLIYTGAANGWVLFGDLGV